MLTDLNIEQAKKETKYSQRTDILHEHNDCIRFAYEWLDAQSKIKTKTTKTRPLKHIIENWAGRYVSQDDVEVAAHMHPDIIGSYPHYNISARLTQPSQKRIQHLSQAHTQHYKSGRHTEYKIIENL